MPQQQRARQVPLSTKGKSSSRLNHAEERGGNEEKRRTAEKLK